MTTDVLRLVSSATHLERFALMSPDERTAYTEPARRELEAHFGAAVDEAVPGLDPMERQRRIDALKSAYYKRVRAANMTRPVRQRPRPARLDSKLHTLAHEMWADETATQRP